MRKSQQEDDRAYFGGVGRRTAIRVGRLLERWSCQLADADLNDFSVFIGIVNGPTDDEAFERMCPVDHESTRWLFSTTAGETRLELYRRYLYGRCDVYAEHPSQKDRRRQSGRLS